MQQFIMKSNEALDRDIECFFHTDFHGVEHPDNPNFLYKLKNDPHHNWSDVHLQNAVSDLEKIIRQDFPIILQKVQPKFLTVCVVPRAKADDKYTPNQLLFKTTIGLVSSSLDGFQDGSNFIRRKKNTRTTHLRRPIVGYDNDGSEPYRGIAKDTCEFSPCIMGLDILLVDDIYTQTVNIDEDMVQALLDNRAKSVVFYAIGRTVRRF